MQPPKRTITAVVALTLLSGAARAQVVRHVDAAAIGPGDGLSWASAFVDLQVALAVPGVTEIRVAQGVYRPDGGTGDRAARFALRNALTIRGGYAGLSGTEPDANDPEAYVTVLSGDLGVQGDNTDNAYRVVVGSGLNASAVLEGVTVTAGNANGASPNASGGGVWLGGTSQSTGPVLRRVRIVQNAGASGAGMYLTQTGPQLIDCVLAGNAAMSNGGAIQAINAGPILQDCVLASNNAQSGGAISAIFSNTVLRGCELSDNLAQLGGGAIHANLGSLRVESSTLTGNQVLGSFSSADGGGAMYLDHVQSAVIVGSAMIANLSYRGGGAAVVSCGSSDLAVLAGCSFFENTAATDGGALLLSGGTPALMNAEFSGNFALSKGGAIHVSASNPSLWFSTLFANVANSTAGGGINVGSGNITLSNCILWSNRNSGGVTEAAQVNDPLNHALVRSSCFQYWSGRYPGSANMALAPVFQNAPGPDGVTGTRDDDLRLSRTSPAIDAGDAALVPPDLADANTNGSTSEPLPVDLIAYLRTVDAVQAPDVGFGPAPLPDMGAFEYRCPADVNSDGQLDLVDFFDFLNAFDAGDEEADVDGSGVVDLTDFFEFLMDFDTSCAA